MTQSIAKLKASDGTGNAAVATVQTIRSALATTIIVDTTQGFPTSFYATMGTPHTFVDPVTSEEITVISDATAVDFSGHISGGNLEIDAIAPGYTDGGSLVGDIVVVRPTTQYADNLNSALTQSLNDDGTLKNNAVTTAVITDANVTTAKIAASAVDSTKVAAGAAVQLVYNETGALATGTTTIPADDTIPQSTEGDQYLSQTITPKSATDILVIEVVALLTSSAATVDLIGALFQDSTANALAANFLRVVTTANRGQPFILKHTMVAGTTSATTFKFRAGAGSAATISFNGTAGSRIFGGVAASSITVTEYKA